MREVPEQPRDTADERAGRRGPRPGFGAGGEPTPAPSPDRSVVSDALALQEKIQAEQALLASGIPGRATITTFTDTGVLVNFDPQVVLDLTVAVGGGPPYELHLTTTVPQIHLSRMRPGADVGVRVDPSEPQRLTIDWSAPTPRPDRGAIHDGEP